MVNKPNVVFVLGGPGAGKGTQCKRICRDYGYVHLSAGDLLREERNTDSEYRDLIETHIRNGTIVPVEITCSLLERAMTKHVTARKGQGDDGFGSGKFLIDGFPRNENNLIGWQKQMDDQTVVQFVLFFDCPDNECVSRCIKRGEAGSGRSDDNAESLKMRIATFKIDTLPIVQHYEKLNMVRKVDASKNPDEVYEHVKLIFN